MIKIKLVIAEEPAGKATENLFKTTSKQKNKQRKQEMRLRSC